MITTDALKAAHEAGLPLPSPAWTLGALLFGLMGWAAWRYGKAAERPRVRWLGAVLLFFPYLVGSTWLLYAVGATVCYAIWWDHRN
jgi:uncharacterized membrane protein